MHKSNQPELFLPKNNSKFFSCSQIFRTHTVINSPTFSLGTGDARTKGILQPTNRRDFGKNLRQNFGIVLLLSTLMETTVIPFVSQIFCVSSNRQEYPQKNLSLFQ